MTIFFNVSLYPPGRAYIVLPLKLFELPFPGFVLLRKTSNDLANLTGGQFYDWK
jgi:hypothetical protein